MRKKRGSGSYELSLDSLIDVFMNALGILMLTAITIAVALPQQQQSKTEHSKPRTANNPKSSQSKQAEVYLAEEATVSTRPLYLLLSGDGARPVDPGNASISDPYFSTSTQGDTDILSPIQNRTLSLNESRRLLSSLSGAERHIVFLVRQDGAKHYRALRVLSTNNNIRSGWMVYERSDVHLSSEGSSFNQVQ